MSASLIQVQPSRDFPALYTAARTALSKLVQIDEIKDIGDKHAAIELYAKQSKDESLMRYAQRIKLRAFERIGELLKEIPNESERHGLAKKYGIAIVTARRAFEAAHIPKRVRDQMIESTPVPSAKRLADAGDGYIPRKPTAWNPRFRRHVDREEGVKAPPKKRAQEVVDYLRAVREDLLGTFCDDGCDGKYTLTQLAMAVDTDDAAEAHDVLRAVARALESFRQALPVAVR